MTHDQAPAGRVEEDSGDGGRPCRVCGVPILDGWGDVAEYEPGRGLTHLACRPQTIPPTPADPARLHPAPNLPAEILPAEILTIAAAATLLAVSRTTLRGYIRRGVLPAFRLHHGPLIRLKRADVLDLLREID